jgi:tetratricopeptide (TPR) repeat protein
MSGETTQSSTPEPAPEPEQSDLLRPKIAITLALLVVLGGALAILQVDASAFESNTARETTRTAVQALRANVVADTVAGLEPALQAERDFLPFRRPLTAGTPSLASAAGLPSRPSTTAGQLRVAQQAVPDLAVESVLPGLQVEAQRLTLKQKALATTRITWNDRSTQYTTVIAVLAAALFLVGFGLVVKGSIRGSAYTLGVAIGIFVLLWGAWVYHLSIPSTPDTAIEAAARGAVLTGNGDYHAAVAEYDKALAADDSYATAYSGRSRATLLGANPDYAVTRAVTDVSGRAFAGARLDAAKAFALDHRNILSADLLAVTSFFDGEYEESGRAADAALALNPKVPDVWLLKSATEVALGDQAAAADSLDRALRLLRGAEPSQRTRLLAATYLSYLAWLQRHDPAHARLARQLANRVVATETRFTLGRALPPAPPARGTVSVQRLRYAGGRLTLQLRWTGLPAGTALSAIEYERPLRTGAWTQPSDLALFATVAGSGRRDISVPLTRACKPTRVRVDVYLNGSPALTRTGPGVAPTC